MIISMDVRIVIELGRPRQKTGLRIEATNGPELVNVYIEDMPQEQKNLLRLIFEGTGMYLASLSGETK
jgi:hypothetical protein